MTRRTNNTNTNTNTNTNANTTNNNGAIAPIDSQDSLDFAAPKPDKQPAADSAIAPATASAPQAPQAPEAIPLDFSAVGTGASSPIQQAELLGLVERAVAFDRLAQIHRETTANLLGQSEAIASSNFEALKGAIASKYGTIPGVAALLEQFHQ